MLGFQPLRTGPARTPKAGKCEIWMVLSNVAWNRERCLISEDIYILRSFIASLSCCCNCNLCTFPCPCKTWREEKIFSTSCRRTCVQNPWTSIQICRTCVQDINPRPWSWSEREKGKCFIFLTSISIPLLCR